MRQGDPLSPLLFVISMEYLFGLLKIASIQDGFKYHPHCKSIGLTHLMFADDLLLFYKGNPYSLLYLMNALTSFGKNVGLRTNL